MDRSSGCNQIHMVPKDEKLTTFHVPKGIHFYKVIPLSLKNTGTTYSIKEQCKGFLKTCSIESLSICWWFSGDVKKMRRLFGSYKESFWMALSLSTKNKSTKMWKFLALRA